MTTMASGQRSEVTADPKVKPEEVPASVGAAESKPAELSKEERFQKVKVEGNNLFKKVLYEPYYCVIPCDTIKGNESLVTSQNIKMLHFDANPIAIGCLVV